MSQKDGLLENSYLKRALIPQLDPHLSNIFFTASLCVNCPKSWWIQVIFKNILLNLNSRPSKIGSLRTFKLKRFVLVVSTVC